MVISVICVYVSVITDIGTVTVHVVYYLVYV
jgi:hypothetical protein